jgi:chorismate dehydratase
VLFGQIDYINCLPLTLPLLEDKPVDMQLKLGNPGQLNAAFAAGELDVGAMSAHYYLQSGAFEILPTVSISSRGKVGSVFLYSKYPLESLDGAHIGLPQASATSVNLLKVLLAEQNITARFSVSGDPSFFDGSAADFDAVLMLGDSALKADLCWSQENSQLYRRDMGQWWFDTYGLPMVFGVWAARKNFVAERPQDFQLLSALLGAAVEKGLSGHFDLVLAEARRRTALPESRLQEYFQSELDYGLGPEHLLGLKLFGQKCSEYGLL